VDLVEASGHLHHHELHDQFWPYSLCQLRNAEAEIQKDQRLAFQKGGGCFCREETEEKMIETIKFLFAAAGIVSILTFFVFVCCFAAWLVDKWWRGR